MKKEEYSKNNRKRHIPAKILSHFCKVCGKRLLKHAGKCSDCDSKIV